MNQRVIWERVDGVLLLDKPPGMSSNAALQRARRLYRADKAGHAGTLDPLASGLLPVLFGDATKFGSALLDGRKRYLAELRFGVTTTTGDAEGEPLVHRSTEGLDFDKVKSAAGRFVGRIDQTPPMYSALKHQGRPLYHYARKGEEIERKPREVQIEFIEVLEMESARAVLDVRCSKGTYIRTLAEDIGEALGVGAHLTGLRRTEVGPFRIDQSRTLEALEEEGTRAQALLPLTCLLDDRPHARLAAESVERFEHGQAVPHPGGRPGVAAVFAPEGRFLGLGEQDEEGRLFPKRLLRTG